MAESCELVILVLCLMLFNVLPAYFFECATTTTASHNMSAPQKNGLFEFVEVT